MKKLSLFLATIAATAPGFALAGGTPEVIETEQVLVSETQGEVDPLILLAGLLVIGVALGGSSSSSTTTTTTTN
jgi:hypothetical protein